MFFAYCERQQVSTLIDDAPTSVETHLNSTFWGELRDLIEYKASPGNERGFDNGGKSSPIVGTPVWPSQSLSPGISEGHP